MRRRIALEIHEQYLSEEALSGGGQEREGEEKFYFPVELDRQVRILFQSKFDQIEQNLNEYLFIEVYAFVLDKLREYFTMFKNSQAFVQLEDEIRRQERLYEVLVEANLINN